MTNKFPTQARSIRQSDSKILASARSHEPGGNGIHWPPMTRTFCEVALIRKASLRRRHADKLRRKLLLIGSLLMQRGPRVGGRRRGEVGLRRIADEEPARSRLRPLCLLEQASLLSKCLLMHRALNLYSKSPFHSVASINSSFYKFSICSRHTRLSQQKKPSRGTPDSPQRIKHLARPRAPAPLGQTSTDSLDANVQHMARMACRYPPVFRLPTRSVALEDSSCICCCALSGEGSLGKLGGSSYEISKQ